MSNAYQIVQKSRELSRVSALEMMRYLCPHFIELHGDRLSGDDKAIIAGIGLIEEQPVTLIGIQKGHNLKTSMYRNFGSAKPSGYRKVQRMLQQAEKFKRPVITFINTAGAYCAPESEEDGIGEAIASTLLMMADLKVPSIAVILGEGGSGGAIALALCDEVWILENATYSILSPEGFASILWKDAKLASYAADQMKLTAPELLSLKIVDRIIPEEDVNGKKITHEQSIAEIGTQLVRKLKTLLAMDTHQRIQAKYERFRRY